MLRRLGATGMARRRGRLSKGRMAEPLSGPLARRRAKQSFSLPPLDLCDKLTNKASLLFSMNFEIYTSLLFCLPSPFDFFPRALIIMPNRLQQNSSHF